MGLALGVALELLLPPHPMVLAIMADIRRAAKTFAIFIYGKAFSALVLIFMQRRIVARRIAKSQSTATKSIGRSASDSRRPLRAPSFEAATTAARKDLPLAGCG